MGNRRRPRNRRPLEHGHELRPGPGEAWCTQIAIVPDRTVDGSVDFAMKQTHDRLIAGLSFRRRSGVRWTTHEPAEAITVLRTLDEGSPVLEEMVGHLAGERSLLVIAWAVGAMPEGAKFHTTGPDTGKPGTEDRLLFVEQRAATDGGEPT